MKYYPFDFHNEHDVVMSLAYNRPEGYRAKLNIRGKYGRADLTLWNNNEIRIYEVKYNPTVNDVAHALGQILLYREQFKDPKKRKIRYIVYVGKLSSNLYKKLPMLLPTGLYTSVTSLKTPTSFSRPAVQSTMSFFTFHRWNQRDKHLEKVFLNNE